VKVRRFAGNPGKKPRYIRMLPHCLNIFPEASQFRIGEIRMDGAVAYRMQLHGNPSAPAFRERMMKFPARS